MWQVLPYLAEALNMAMDRGKILMVLTSTTIVFHLALRSINLKFYCEIDGVVEIGSKLNLGVECRLQPAITTTLIG